MIKVKDIMTDRAFAFKEGRPIDVVCDLMAMEEMSCVPVVGDDYRFCGLVVHGDLLARIVGRVPGSEGGIVSCESLRRLSVADVMRRDVPTVGPEDFMGQAIMAYLEGGVGCLPVVAGGLLVGMLMEKDIFPVLMRMVASPLKDGCFA